MMQTRQSSSQMDNLTLRSKTIQKHNKLTRTLKIPKFFLEDETTQGDAASYHTENPCEESQETTAPNKKKLQRVKFTKKYSIIRLKRRKFVCFDEEEVVIQKQFKTLLKTHNTDNDKDTNDEQIKNAQKFMLNDLFACVTAEKALPRRSTK